MPRRTLDDPVARAFGATLRKTRLDANLTVETVAGNVRRVGRDGGPSTMDPKYLAAIEQGFHSPTVSTAKQIADALGTPLSDLVRDL